MNLRLTVNGRAVGCRDGCAAVGRSRRGREVALLAPIPARHPIQRHLNFRDLPFSAAAVDRLWN